MVLVQRDLDNNVLEAANERIIRIFENGLPVHLSLSGGKDSICLANLVYELVISEQIDKSLLRVHFIDEEAVFDDVDKIVREWRLKFITAGVEFFWWCLEFKHFNCFNQLANDETFICWDRTMKDSWVRPMPDFAISSHPKFVETDYLHIGARKATYQEFFTGLLKNELQIIGVRTAESVQRLYAVSQMNNAQSMKFYPIYDWKDGDVWRYIRDKNLNFPVVYQYMYQTGTSRRDLRISQFFSIDTSKHLVKMNEYYPDLMERITKREPNAYLASLYWDSEMFRRTKEKKSKDSETTEEKDYRSLVIEFINNPANLVGRVKISNINAVRIMLLKFQSDVTEKEYKRMYEILVAGDPKSRSLRALNLTLRANDWERNQNDSKN